MLKEEEEKENKGSASNLSFLASRGEGRRKEKHHIFFLAWRRNNKRNRWSSQGQTHVGELKRRTISPWRRTASSNYAITLMLRSELYQQYHSWKRTREVIAAHIFLPLEALLFGPLQIGAITLQIQALACPKKKALRKDSLSYLLFSSAIFPVV